MGRTSPPRCLPFSALHCLFIVLTVVLGALLSAPNSAEADWFGSTGAGYGTANSTSRTGKQAVQDDSVYCQQTPEGQVIPKPYGGTRRNIPCGPGFAKQPQRSPSVVCDGPSIRSTQDLAKLVFRNYDTEPILIVPLCNQSNVYLVTLSGTQFKAGQPTGLQEIFASAFRWVDNYSRAVVRSLIQSNVPTGATIILAGHSLGGMVAQNLPVLPELGYNQRWLTARVITLGSPIMNQLRLPASITRRFAIRGDPVVTQAPYWAGRLGFKAMFFPPDISGLSGDPIWVDGGPGYLDPRELHLAYPKSSDLEGFDALGDRSGTRSIQVNASQELHWGTDFSQERLPIKTKGVVYRGGSRTPQNMTPRPNIDNQGLSTFETLEQAVKPGDKAQIIDLSLLQAPLVAVPDAPPEGHVSIRPGAALTPAALRNTAEWAATRGTPTIHPYTQSVIDAVIDEKKRPK